MNKNRSGINRPKKVDTAKKKPPAIRQSAQPETSFKCCCCGAEYQKQQGNFPFSQSQVYMGNNSYLPICNSCCEDLMTQYTELLGSEEAAIKRMCQRWDVYYSDQLLEQSLNAKLTQTRWKKYLSMINLMKYKGMTFDTYLIESRGEKINALNQLEKFASGEMNDADEIIADEYIPDKQIIETFGVGYTREEYKILESQYNSLSAKAGKNIDDVQRILIQDLCNTEILKRRALAKGDVDSYDKTSKLYQATLAKAQLDKNTLGDDDGLGAASFGAMIRMIEEFTPAEVYKDKHLFEDHDKIQEYFQRFIVRPFKNFFTGSNDKDPEFSVGDENADEE